MSLTQVPPLIAMSHTLTDLVVCLGEKNGQKVLSHRIGDP